MMTPEGKDEKNKEHQKIKTKEPKVSKEDKDKPETRIQGLNVSSTATVAERIDLQPKYVHKKLPDTRLTGRPTDDIRGKSGHFT
ncbi:hypothetical protein C922_05553 [Plasmodium inui San Antonio 1]|uniref:Uncharacterized protein n=1 Tax=Plasmodium inui San Antonio 1 TaxID=1237626 RepID=W7AFK9_9APIC|nr:hypothetical protein C922_05553 [Plasmodium inui San Antonio 1]EUD64066.1 hypothetical protein C922_05553 [Plasmodium inui San Antonio 1]